MSWRGCRTMLAAANRSSASVLKPPKVSSLARPLKVTPALSEFVGAPEVSRGHTMKKIWEYIKLHNLQNPTNRRQIICDAKLKTIFSGKDTVGMLEIGKLINPHFIKDE
uniref:DM2 domain-containing protein n=1 Tax=Kalanchoe fedtschenkoi TaxID=63787 RepID=A0A7N0TCY9_KALFE